MKRFLLLVLGVLLSAGVFAPRARAQAACCTITAINSQTGIVAATVNASGATFDFKLPNVNFLKQVRVGQGVFANFTSHQVSLDGRTVCCSIISGPTASTTLPATSTTTPATPAKPAVTPPGASASAAKSAPAATAGACCAVTAIDASAGQATAKVNSSGQTFVFTASGSVLSSLQVGQAVFANFTGKQVSFDGKSVGGTIISGPTAAGAASASAAKPVTQPATSSAAAAPAASAPAATAAPSSAAAAAPQSASPMSSGAAAVPARASTVTGAGSGATASPTTGTSAAASKPVSASSATAVRAPVTSVMTPEDQALTCMSVGALTGAQSKASTAAPGSTSASPTNAETAAKSKSTSTTKLATQTAASNACTPRLSFGTPQPIASITSPVAVRLVTPTTTRWEARTLTAVVAGKSASANIVHLHGLDGIEQAQGLPDAARAFLILHVKQLPAGAADGYIVNLDLANEWAKTHPAPPSATPPAPTSDGTAGCNSFSWHCAQEAGQHAIDQASQQADQLREQAEKDWGTATGDATKLWNETGSCFNEQTLNASGATGQVNADPSIGYTLTESGKTSGSGITASGTATGKVNLAFPFGGDFQAAASATFIPCLPFMIRPTGFSGGGDFTIGSKLTASLNASGQFDYKLQIPVPAASATSKIPIEVIPIVIFGIPICEMDVSAYFEGDLDVSATGKLTANFELDNPHEVAFNFSCSESSCTGSSQTKKLPATTTENAQLSAQINVTPDVYTAIQLDFDIDIISVRSGPEPTLYGVLSGCLAGTATQTVGGGPSSSESWHLLTGDVDWGVRERSDLLVFGTQVGNSWMFPTILGRTHLWYDDLWPGGSNALDAIVTAPTTAVASGTAGEYKVSMPGCYPYTDKVTYKVAWTGNAKGANSSTAAADCLLGDGGAQCVAAPTAPFGIDFTWPAAGSDSLTVIPVSDTHGRVFKSAQATQVNVDVQGPPISTAADTAVKP
jgi:hypothetical protein